MAARKPYALSISCTNVSSSHIVTIFNRTNKESLTGVFDSSGHTVIDLANLTTEIAVNDQLEIKVNGKYEAYTVHTITTTSLNNGGTDIELTSVATSSTLADVSL